jgi:hypothetical protein
MCPVCKQIYGTKEGICPPGTMTFQSIDHRLPGHPDHGTIHIKYCISNGIQVSTASSSTASGTASAIAAK